MIVIYLRVLTLYLYNLYMNKNQTKNHLDIIVEWLLEQIKDYEERITSLEVVLLKKEFEKTWLRLDWWDNSLGYDFKRSLFIYRDDDLTHVWHIYKKDLETTKSWLDKARLWLSWYKNKK